jgi:hypothetical protein
MCFYRGSASGNASGRTHCMAQMAFTQRLALAVWHAISITIPLDALVVKLSNSSVTTALSA